MKTESGSGICRPGIRKSSCSVKMAVQQCLTCVLSGHIRRNWLNSQCPSTEIFTS